MYDATLALDIAAAASTAASSLLLLLCAGGEGDGEVEGEGEGLEAVTDRVVAVGNHGRPHLPCSSPATPPLSLSVPLSLCLSQSTSKRPDRGEQSTEEMMRDRRVEGGKSAHAVNRLFGLHVCVYKQADL